MRTLILTRIGILLAVSASAHATPPVVKVADGQWKGDRYAVYAYSHDSLHREAGAIEVEKAVPLSPSDAIKRASVALKLLVGAALPRFSCGEVLLRRQDEGLGDWFYVVRFFSNEKEDWTRDGDKIYPASIPFIVHLDGHVRPPNK